MKNFSSWLTTRFKHKDVPRISRSKQKFVKSEKASENFKRFCSLFLKGPKSFFDKTKKLSLKAPTKHILEIKYIAF